MKRIVFIFCFLTTFFSWSQKLEPFKIFSANGKVISNKKFLKKISEHEKNLYLQATQHIKDSTELAKIKELFEFVDEYVDKY